MYQIVEYFRVNPRATAEEAVDYFSKELNIAQQSEHLRDEVSKSNEFREKLRPLLGQKRDLEERSRNILSDVESEVMLEFPKGKGSEKDRKELKDKLLKENKHYADLDKEFQSLSMEIYELETQRGAIEQAAKNARRLTELFTAYVQFINLHYK